MANAQKQIKITMTRNYSILWQTIWKSTTRQEINCQFTPRTNKKHWLDMLASLGFLRRDQQLSSGMVSLAIEYINVKSRTWHLTVSHHLKRTYCFPHLRHCVMRQVYKGISGVKETCNFSAFVYLNIRFFLLTSLLIKFPPKRIPKE